MPRKSVLGTGYKLIAVECSVLPDRWRKHQILFRVRRRTYLLPVTTGELQKFASIRRRVKACFGLTLRATTENDWWTAVQSVKSVPRGCAR